MIQICKERAEYQGDDGTIFFVVVRIGTNKIL